MNPHNPPIPRIHGVPSHEKTKPARTQFFHRLRLVGRPAEHLDAAGLARAHGWREHVFRFNVLWNGTILAEPHMNRRTEKWKGLGVQLSFSPSVRMPVRHGVRITFTLPADLPAAASNAAWA